MKKTPLILVAAGLLVGLLSAGNDWADKPFLEWSEKEAKSILQLSPWSKTQTIAELPTPQGPSPGRRALRGKRHERGYFAQI